MASLVASVPFLGLSSPSLEVQIVRVRSSPHTEDMACDLSKKGYLGFRKVVLNHGPLLPGNLAVHCDLGAMSHREPKEGTHRKTMKLKWFIHDGTSEDQSCEIRGDPLALGSSHQTTTSSFSLDLWAHRRFPMTC